MPHYCHVVKGEIGTICVASVLSVGIRVTCRRRRLSGLTPRRLSINICGMICLTLLMGSSRGLRGRVESRQQISEATEIPVPEIGAPGANDRGGIGGSDIGPLQR
jgi:hypothetical protein